MNPLLLFAALLLGLVLGVIVAWLFLTGRHEQRLSDTNTASQAELATLAERVSSRDQQLASRETQVAELQASLARERDKLAAASAELAAANAQLAAAREEQGKLVKELAAAREDSAVLRDNGASAKQTNAELTEKIKYLEERLAGERREIEQLREKFQKDFEATANKLLIENSSRFGQQSAENLTKILAPLRENLTDFKAKLELTQKDTAAHSALLKDQIARIGSEAANLTRALKGDVKVLGNWGENMLDQILERSGLQQGIHYRRQSAVRDEAGGQRFLDVIIDLPEGRHLVIDSKVSLKNYEQYVNCGEPSARQAHLDSHLVSLRAHFKGLGGRRYQDAAGVSAPDFVLMYIPIEAAFFVAVSEEPGLFSEALEKNVVLITNSSLLATLRTVAHVWRLADQQRHALEIAERGGKLYDKFAGFVEDLEGVGGALKKAQDSWSEASRKLSQGNGNLLSQIETLRKLGVKASRKLPPALLSSAEQNGNDPALGK